MIMLNINAHDEEVVYRCLMYALDNLEGFRFVRVDFESEDADLIYRTLLDSSLPFDLIDKIKSIIY